MHTKHHIIIGNSAAGIAAARTLRKLNQYANITVITQESLPPYNKCFIADFVAGIKTDEQLVTLTDTVAQELNIRMLYNQRVDKIVSDNKIVMLLSGECIKYDTLLIATGSRVWVPPIKHLGTQKNFYTFGTYADAQAIDSALRHQSIKHVVVVGAGLSGLEIADALHVRGVQVTIIEHADHVLGRHVTVTGARRIVDNIKAAGISLKTNMAIAEVQSIDNYVHGVVCTDGTFVACDMLVLATGMRQNSKLASDAGIVCDPLGISVNENMQTSHPDIYAAGDVIRVYDHLLGTAIASCTWPDAMQQGMHAAYAMSDQPRAYKGTHLIVSSAFFGLKFASCGPIHEVDQNYTCIERTSNNAYYRYILDGNVLKGFVAIDQKIPFAELKRAVLTGEPYMIKD